MSANTPQAQGGGAMTPQGREWQFIETAPKDGTVIGIWNPKEPQLIRYALWGTFGRHESWLSARHNPLTNLPTHWMPLPDPPTASPVREEPAR